MTRRTDISRTISHDEEHCAYCGCELGKHETPELEFDLRMAGDPNLCTDHYWEWVLDNIGTSAIQMNEGSPEFEPEETICIVQTPTKLRIVEVVFYLTDFCTDKLADILASEIKFYVEIDSPPTEFVEKFHEQFNKKV